MFLDDIGPFCPDRVLMWKTVHPICGMSNTKLRMWLPGPFRRRLIWKIQTKRSRRSSRPAVIKMKISQLEACHNRRWGFHPTYMEVLDEIGIIDLLEMAGGFGTWIVTLSQEPRQSRWRWVTIFRECYWIAYGTILRKDNSKLPSLLTKMYSLPYRVLSCWSGAYASVV